ncbi:hypothetical protein Pmani_012334 [Petrolisthes manimaculis]|uniref:Uncharacterized protein n=1 Tax=Petrolisthes manimaculis TaxID=1843537 RepID=A0AAE1Q0Z9_9EUCA|nr:hypothetical protein Pmani_012334 [Petrolisthes manimaculis]
MERVLNLVIEGRVQCAGGVEEAARIKVCSVLTCCSQFFWLGAGVGKSLVTPGAGWLVACSPPHHITTYCPQVKSQATSVFPGGVS